MITRRGFLGLTGASLAAGGLALTGCGTGTRSSDSALRFAWWGNDVRHRLTEKAVDLFTKDHPGVKVTTQPGDWTGYWDKLAVSVAGGDAPDVIQQVDPYIAEYAQRGALADLRDIKGIDLSPFDEGVMATGIIDGAVYGVPSGLTSIAVWYNAGVLKEVGVELPDTDAWSWDDYARVCERVNKRSGGRIAGSNPLSFDHETFTVFARQRGEALYKGKSLGFTKDTLEEWFEYVLRLQGSKATWSAQKAVEEYAKSVEENALATGRAAFGTGWSNQFTGVMEASKDVDLRMVQLPGESSGPRRGIYVKASQMYSISAKSARKDDAAELVNAMVSDVAIGKILLADRGVPAHAKVLAAVQAKFPKGDVLAAAYIDKVGKLVQTPLPPSPVGASTMVTAFPRHTQDVLFKRASVADAAESLISEMTQALS